MRVTDRLQKTCLLVIAGTAAGLAMYWLRPVLVPFVLALFFASGLAPVLAVLEGRLRIPRMMALAITMLLGMMLVALLVGMIAWSVADLNGHLPEYQEKVSTLLANVGGVLNPEPAEGDAEAETPFWGFSGWRGPAAAPSDSKAGEAANEGSPPLIDLASQGVRDMLVRVSLDLMDIVSNATMVVIFLMFMLLGGEASAGKTPHVWATIDQQVRLYIVAKTIISILTGAAVSLVLWLFGVPLAIVFGILAFLFNYIPNIGPIVASLLPLPLVLLELSPIPAAIVMLLTCGIQIVSGNVVEPKIMGDTFDLHPVVVLLALMFCGITWGLVGMFLATPMVAALKIICERFDETRSVAHLLAGRLDKLEGIL